MQTSTLTPFAELEKKLKPMNTTKDLAAIGIPLSTQATWRQNGGGPQFVKAGNLVMYPKECVLIFFRSHLFKSTSDAGYPGSRT